MRDRKLHPYRVGILLLYGHIAGLERVTPTDIVLETSSVANHLGLSNARLREYIADLHRYGVIDEFSMGHGFVKLSLTPPEGFEAIMKTINAEAVNG